VDPLERLSIGEVMTKDVVTVSASMPVRELVGEYFFGRGPRKHPAYPVVDKTGALIGLVTQSNLLDHWMSASLGGPGAQTVDLLGTGPIIAYDLVGGMPVVANPADSCRVAAERMALAGVKRLPVVDPSDPGRLVGIVTLGDLLQARQRLAEEEDRRERFIDPGRFAPGFRR
jgi:CBS domain-containing protein